MRTRHTTSRRRFALLGATLGAFGTGALSAKRDDRPDEDSGNEATPKASPVGTPEATPVRAHPVMVIMTIDLRFDPTDLVIPVNTTVTWNNESPLPHTATGDPEQNPLAKTHPEYVTLPDGAEPWGSDLLQPGTAYSHTFDLPGEYRYICIPHVMSGMRGTIIVEG